VRSHWEKRRVAKKAANRRKGGSRAAALHIAVRTSANIFSGDGGRRGAEHEGYHHVRLDRISFVSCGAEIPIL
jgi:hypothetical protein